MNYFIPRGSKTYYRLIQWSAVARYGLTLCIVVCLIVSWRFLCYGTVQQYIGTYQKNNNETELLKKLTDTKKAACERELQHYQSTINELMRELNQLHSQSASSKLDFLKSIVSLIATAGLKLEYYGIEQEDTKKTHIRLSLRIACTGSFEAIMTFFAALTKSTCLLAWRQYELTRVDDTLVACAGLLDVFVLK